ncbi:glycerate kinase [Sporosarcina sp. G11-34]|uniref:glycerate kinase n=1 Tax=Sporosarcina sp. G11-34 TaxID=2849605 RepID=UPI0022A9F491|nr:glycerate kinase [Sporosarcina sp. G11-34]MCZ2258285.1 glycerate kinase [Sporosarcina sp. G11-34]
MKIIVAPDSFKGSLTAVEAAKAMEAGIKDYDSTIETVLLPAADGGEGTMSSLVGATDGRLVTVFVQDPLGRQIEASYGILGDEETCVIEIAEASGLMLLNENELNPLQASSFGTGELIFHALEAGYRKFIIGLGGSATNDGGAGMLKALGMKLLDQNGVELSPGGGSLGNLQAIDSTGFDKRVSESSFIIACDVENPFVGPKGASAVFGPQKGATAEMIELLDANLTKFANVVEKLNGNSLHAKKGAGAAGGAGGTFQAFFPCEMKQGISVVLKAISFDEHLQKADLVLTGEGKTDVQTLSGKTPFGIAQVAKREGKKVILISGALDEKSRVQLAPFFTELHAIADETVSAEDSMKQAYRYLRLKTKQTIENYFAGDCCS